VCLDHLRNLQMRINFLRDLMEAEIYFAAFHTNLKKKTTTNHQLFRVFFSSSKFYKNGYSICINSGFKFNNFFYTYDVSITLHN
jgi:hypothetical protein